jgi:hypothetical protein
MRKTATERAALAPRPTNNRSRLTNGAALLAGRVDQRSAPARRYRDLVSQIVVDLGGVERLSETKLQLIRRFAAISVMSEQMEAKLASGQSVDVGALTQLASTAVRLSARIGLSRHAKLVPDLKDYLEGKATG